jgi:hypothetical protein
LYDQTVATLTKYVELAPRERSPVARRTVRLADGEHWLYREWTAVGESNGAAIVYLQCGALTRRQQLLLSVLGPVIGDQVSFFLFVCLFL